MTETSPARGPVLGPGRLELSAPADPAILELVHAMLEHLWQQDTAVSDRDRLRFETAVIEILGNIVEHAYQVDHSDAAPPAEESRRFDIRVSAGPQELVATFEDNGLPAELDLEHLAMPDDLAESGRGLALAGMLADAWGVTYTPRAKRVWVRMEVGDGYEPQEPPAQTPGAPPAVPLETLRVGVLAADLDGVVESWNTDAERLLGEKPRDAPAGEAVAIDRIRHRLAARKVLPNRRRDLFTVVRDVEHVAPALAPLLPRADVPVEAGAEVVAVHVEAGDHVLVTGPQVVALPDQLFLVHHVAQP